MGPDVLGDGARSPVESVRAWRDPASVDRLPDEARQLNGSRLRRPAQHRERQGMLILRERRFDIARTVARPARSTFASCDPLHPSSRCEPFASLFDSDEVLLCEVRRLRPMDVAHPDRDLVVLADLDAGQVEGDQAVWSYEAVIVSRVR